MPNHYRLDLSKQPFYLAGKKVESVTFVVGEEWLNISLSRCDVDKDGAVVVRLLPEQARQIARELTNNADKDQRKRSLLL